MKRCFFSSLLEKAGETFSSLIIKRMRASNAPESQIAEVMAAPQDVLEETTLELTANLSPKAFEQSLAMISGLEVPAEEVDHRAKVKAWMKRQGISKERQEMKQDLAAQKDKLETEEDKQAFKEMEAILSGPDDGVIDLMLASVDDQMLKKMSFYAHLGEAFDFPFKSNTGRPRDVVIVNTEFSHHDVSIKTEDDLIDDLNLLEFERDKPAQGANIFRAFSSGKPNARLASAIRETQEQLRKLQGGSLTDSNCAIYQ